MVNCLSSDIFTHFATPFSIFNVYYSLFNDYYFNTLTCDKQGLSINIFVKIIYVFMFFFYFQIAFFFTDFVILCDKLINAIYKIEKRNF